MWTVKKTGCGRNILTTERWLLKVNTWKDRRRENTNIITRMDGSARSGITGLDSPKASGKNLTRAEHRFCRSLTRLGKNASGMKPRFQKATKMRNEAGTAIHFPIYFFLADRFPGKQDGLFDQRRSIY